MSTIRAYPVTITKNAWDKLNKIRSRLSASTADHFTKNDSNSRFLFSATSGGCNGFNYNLRLVDDENQLFDVKPTVIKKNHIHVIVDPMSEMMLFGTTIDYVSENFDKNIFESKFIFIPDKNTATTCGCGISFAPK